MGSFFSDMFGIEAAGDSLAEALVAAQVNATLELRNVTLTAINYIKSFTPLFSLIMLFMILLLVVSTLFILNRALLDLNVSAIVRQRVVTAIALLLYLWLLVFLIVSAINQKSKTFIVSAGLVGVGFLVIIGLWIWFQFCSRRNNRTKPHPARRVDAINLNEQY